MSVFWLEKVAVTAKNTSFDEDLAIVVVKQVLVYNLKTTFRYVAGVELSSCYRCKMSKCSSCTRYKSLLGFFNGRFENRHQNLRIFSVIPANLHIVTVTKHWHASSVKTDLINCYFIKPAFTAKYWFKAGLLIWLIWCRDDSGDRRVHYVKSKDKFKFITETLQRSPGHSVYFHTAQKIS